MASSTPPTWADLAGRRVGLWGVGVEGLAMLQRLTALAAEVLLVDDKPSGPVGDHEVTLIAEGGLALLQGCEFVLKSPGVSRYRPEIQSLVAAGIPVLGGMGLTLAELDASNIAAITGTKGKSTTTHLVGHLLSRLGRDVLLGGNLGETPYDPIRNEASEFVVLELSSFQITDLATAPRIVAITSLGVDHVDWHGSPERYQADKLSLASLPGVETVLISAEDHGLRTALEAMGVTASLVDADDRGLAGRLGLTGQHNQANAALALAIVECLIGSPIASEALADLAEEFHPLPGRFTEIALHDGVRFIDDSLATNVLPSIAALSALETERVAMLIGGFDRGIDYQALAAAIAARSRDSLVLCLPDNGPAIGGLISAFKNPLVSVELYDSIEAAVPEAFAWAQAEGGVVLLSPAAPSFSQFSNWLHRSEVFGQAVQSLIAE
ncbi:MAG: UDP-N-acetylmuramoyl-L-alanine--D-glutamate ligase [Actinomycetes bacterium]